MDSNALLNIVLTAAAGFGCKLKNIDFDSHFLEIDCPNPEIELELSLILSEILHDYEVSDE